MELSRKKVIISLVVIILLQSIVYYFVACNKNYIHIDEGYSYGLINYDKLDISWNSDFYNKWHNKDYYTDYLVIDENEAGDWSPVYEQQKNDVHPPFYYFLLRVFTSFNIDSFSKWPGIALNMVIHIGTTIFTYLITSRLFKNKKYGLGIALVSGLTVASFEMVLFTRMYALTALNILIVAYLHLKIYDKDKLDIKSLGIMVPFIVLGSLTHYFYLVFLFALYVLFMIKYLSKKEFRNAIKYTGCMVVSAIISLLIFPYSFVHMFMGYRGQGMISHFSNAQETWLGIGKYSSLVLLDVFNGVYIIALIGIIGILIYEYFKNKEVKFTFKNKEVLFVALPTIIYFVIIAMGTPYREIRYLTPIVPLIFILLTYGLVISLKRAISEGVINKLLLSTAVIMIFIPLVTNWNISYQYPEMKEFVDSVDENHFVPALYIFNTDANRFMDDILLFTKIDNSYIMDSKLASEEEIQKVFSGKDLSNGLTLFINSNLENDKYINMILDATSLDECKYTKRLNACDVYYLF